MRGEPDITFGSNYNSPSSGRLTRCWVGLVYLFFMVLITTASFAADPQSGQNQGSYAMKVTHVCLITPQFAKMQEFYRRLLHVEPKQFQMDYVEFQIPGAIISLYEEASFAQDCPGWRAQTRHRRHDAGTSGG